MYKNTTDVFLMKTDHKLNPKRLGIPRKDFLPKWSLTRNHKILVSN